MKLVFTHKRQSGVSRGGRWVGYFGLPFACIHRRHIDTLQGSSTVTHKRKLSNDTFLLQQCIERASALRKPTINQEHPQTVKPRKRNQTVCQRIVCERTLCRVKGASFACQRPSLCSWSKAHHNATGYHIRHTRQIM